VGEAERTAAAARRRRSGNRILAFLILLATLAVYLQVCRHPFAWLDDAAYVTQNPHVRGGLSVQGLRWAAVSLEQANWHPLTWFSHMADVELFGLSPGPHHLVSVLWHGANALLLFALFLAATGARLRSAFVAALFALHPLHVESVAWIAERKDVLSSCFGLLALLAYVRYARAPRAATYLPVPLLYAASLAAKPMLVSLPVLLLLLDRWPLGRLGPAAGRPGAAPQGRRLGALLLEKVPLLLLSAAASALAVAAQDRAVADLERFPLWVRSANAALAWVGYLVKTFVPYPLSVFYPHPGGSIVPAAAAGACLLLASITLAALRGRQARPALATGWFWFLAGLLPVIGLVQVGMQAMADRYSYLPQTGLAIMVAWGIAGARAPARQRRLLAAAASVGIALCAVLSYFQVRLWRSDAALFAHAVRHTRGNYVAHNALGTALALGGQPREAADQIREALRIRPDYPLAWYNMGVLLERLGDLDGAALHYGRALRLDARSARAATNLGGIEQRRGRRREAAEYYRAALRADPGDAVANNNLGVILLGEGRAAEAAAAFSRSLERDPANPDATANLARALAAGGSRAPGR
jgi:Flp pilus assembly protein TadD